uniref:Glutaryl-7-aminocephalosporanic acid acylase n=1 Tax=Pseudomonas sp. THA2 TaxID=233897 RepID=Q7X2I0_9PSED|nr:glutaryl-7-aminocephalosporanic acid acylase [Pseudomonas sp. THA2]
MLRVLHRATSALVMATVIGLAPGVAFALAEPTSTPQAPIAAYKPRSNEILWDGYGIPHIYGVDAPSAFYGYGWAQARSHGDNILRLYGEARGKGAEYWGPDYEQTTVWLLTNGVPERAQQWYAQQSLDFRANLDAFAAGINANAEQNPDDISPEVRQVLPVSGADVVAHAHRLTNFLYVASPGRTLGEGDPPDLADQGSNSWAVAPGKTANGNALLLQNPHLSWTTDYFTYYEAHLVTPDFEVYGATQIGLPVIRFAFNQRMGIANTVNGMVGATNYRLTLQDGGYLHDGQVRPFERRQASYRLRQADGSTVDKPLEIRSSVHGPVFERADGTAVAVRVAGLDRPGMLEQYFDMITADSFDDYEAAMARMQVPTFNIVYADREGTINYSFNGVAPKRAEGDIAFWQGLVPGDSSRYLWTETHPLDDLPRVTNPPGGFVQNSNDPPWTSTWPVTYTPKDFPSYLAPQTPHSLRAQQSVRLMSENDDLTLERFMALQLSHRAVMADRTLPDLIPAALIDPDPEVQAAARLLAAWDREFASDSRAALLFEEWARLFAGQNFARQAGFATPWSLDKPVSTPYGVRDTKAAVDQLRTAIANTKRKYGAIDRSFGDASRMILNDVNVPGAAGYGNLGSFRVFTWSDPDENGVRTPVHGETWVAMIEFSTPVRAYGLMSYGNSRQPGTTHYSDQIERVSRADFRELLLRREQVEVAVQERTPLNFKP